MGFESFLQVLKRMFENCNWKSPAFSVARMWALRRAFRRKRGLPEAGGGGEYSFSCGTDELIVGPALRSAASTSPLIAAVMRGCPDVSAVRYLTELKVCSLHLEVQDWVLLRQESHTMAAQIAQMGLVRIAGRTVVRRRCCGCLAGKLLEDADGMMRVSKQGKFRSVLVDFERVAVSSLSCTDRGDHWEFRYIF